MEAGASKKSRKELEMESDFPAPDGGWGWVVCLAVGLGQVSYESVNLFKYGTSTMNRCRSYSNSA